MLSNFPPEKCGDCGNRVCVTHLSSGKFLVNEAAASICLSGNFSHFQPREAEVAPNGVIQRARSPWKHGGPELTDEGDCRTIVPDPAPADHIRDAPTMVEPAPGEPVVSEELRRVCKIAATQHIRGNQVGSTIADQDALAAEVARVQALANPPAESQPAKALPPIETLAGSCPDMEYPYTAEEGKLGRLVGEVLAARMRLTLGLYPPDWVKPCVAKINNGYEHRADSLDEAIQAALADAAGGN